MTEKTAEIDQLKGNTLEQISQMVFVYCNIFFCFITSLNFSPYFQVEQIGREFKSKQTQLQPLMAELKVLNSV